MADIRNHVGDNASLAGCESEDALQVKPSQFGVDEDGRHKYVWRFGDSGPVYDGYEALVPYGWMWDGASCVKDLYPPTSCWHDWGYSVGLFVKDGEIVTLSKRKMDWIYANACGDIQWWRKYTRWVGLRNPISYMYYRKARKRLDKHGTQHIISSNTIPHVADWSFPTYKTRDAIWTRF